MSSKCSILYTSDNEHWYSDCNEPVKDQAGAYVADAITLEFSKENIRVEINDDQDLVITIFKDCPLLRTLALSADFISGVDKAVSKI